MQSCFSGWLLTFSFLFSEWRSPCQCRNMNYQTRAGFFFFFWDRTVVDHFFDFENLTGCVQVQLTWKLSRYFDTWRDAHFSLWYLWCHAKKKESKKDFPQHVRERWSIMTDIAFSLLEFQEMVCFVYQLSLKAGPPWGYFSHLWS